MSTRLQAIVSWLETHEQEAIRFLEALVNQDSGTDDRAGVNRVGDILARAYEGLGFSVRRIRQSEFGDHLLASHGSQGRGNRSSVWATWTPCTPWAPPRLVPSGSRANAPPDPASWT